MKTAKTPSPSNRCMVTAFLLLGLLTLLGTVSGCSSGEAASSEAVTVEGVPYDLSRSFTVAPGGRLVIDADRGSIEVATGGEETVRVDIFRKVTRKSAKKAHQLVEGHRVTFDQDGTTVFVRARSDQNLRNWRSLSSGLQVRYVVTVPREFDLDLKTAGGSITVPDLTGTVVAGTSGGSIKLAAIDGPVTCRTSGGGISVESATQPIDARTSGGTIEVGVIHASAKLSTSGGSVRINESRGVLEAGTSGGGISVKRAFASVDASTSGGSVHVGLADSFHGDCRLSTSGGNVNVDVPEGINANLDARTSGGTVRTDLPVTVQGELKRSELVGRIGDGGKVLKLRTSGGSIRINKG